VEYIDETWALLQFANTKLALVLPHEHPSHFALTRPDANKFGDLVTNPGRLYSVNITAAFGNSTPRSRQKGGMKTYGTLSKVLTLFL
jgi:hypothetical protein